MPKRSWRSPTAQAPLADRPIEHSAFDAATSGMADGLVVTGDLTGLAADLDDGRAVRSTVPDKMIIVGIGTTVDNIQSVLEASSSARR